VDKATGNEGGAVAEQIPANEAKEESPEAEAAAPEEQADQAQPVPADAGAPPPEGLKIPDPGGG